MSQEINVKGIIRYQALLQERAPTDYPENKSWNVTVLIKEGSEDFNNINNAYNAELNAIHPNGLPAGSNSCWKALEGDLAGYWQLALKQDCIVTGGLRKGQHNDKPLCVGLDNQPVITPDSIKCGDLIRVVGNIVGYAKNATSNGMSGYLIGSQIQGVAGELDPSLLSARRGAAELFGGGAAVAPVAPAPAPSPTPAPAPQAGAPVKEMTSLATNSYDEYISAGWTDRALVEKGLMLESLPDYL